MRLSGSLQWAFAAWVALGAMLAAPHASVAEEFNLLLGAKPGVGGYLTDATGRALYVFAGDIKGAGTSTCAGECAEKWPPFSVSALKAGPGVPAVRNVTEVKRTDGRGQLAFRGYPLYYHAADKEAGDIKGDGANGKWFLAKVPFYTVMVSHSAALGTHLVGPEGKTLYHSLADTKNSSTCTGDCTKSWRPFHEARLILPSSLGEPDFGTIERTDGNKQTTYKGHPLYWLSVDRKPGETKGQGKDENWFVADPSKLK